MSWMSLICGIFVFLTVLTIHIFIWRVLKPKNQVSLLFIIFLIIPFMGFVLAAFFIKLAVLLVISLLYFALSCAYIQTYPVFQAVTPSLQIIHLLDKADFKTLTLDEIMNNFTRENLVQDRLEDLLAENFVYQKGDDLFLASKGAFLARTFSFYRSIYGLKMGDG